MVLVQYIIKRVAGAETQHFPGMRVKFGRGIVRFTLYVRTAAPCQVFCNREGSWLGIPAPSPDRLSRT